MAKNLMVELAKLLGVELGEKFIIQNADRKETVVLAMDGFHVIQPNNVLSPDHGKLLSKVLQGLYEVKKLPWKPKHGERYYCPCVQSRSVGSFSWANYSLDYAMLVLGMVYRTREEAEEHLAEDYQRLTGKPLDGQLVVPGKPLDSLCVTVNSLSSLSGR